MKKSNSSMLLTFCILIITVILFAFFCKNHFEKTDTKAKENTDSNSSQSEVITDSSKAESLSSVNSQSSSQEIYEKADAENENAVSLFIGDSRTVGLMEYSAIENADFFCNVGMSVYNIQKNTVAVPTVGKVTLTELLNNKKYDRIYIMLGINEVGYKFETTVQKYSELIGFIKEKQQNAIIIIQANLHVTKSRSVSDKDVTNSAIDGLNSQLSKLANNKDVFYIDANPVFDDESGNLASDKTGDSAHLYAKYYKSWGDWITTETVDILKGE